MVTPQALKWPSRKDSENRIEPICVPFINPRFVFRDRVSVFTVGSCFARNIEEYLKRLGMIVPTLDFSAPPSEFPTAERVTGLLNKYTPHSILSEFRFALEGSYPLSVDDHFVKIDEDKYFDLHLPSYTAVSLDRARERRNQIKELFQKVLECELIVITLGLIEAWYDNLTSSYVAQQPPPRIIAQNKGRFSFKRLDFSETVETIDRTVNLLWATSPEKKILLTTSPVPLARTFTDQDVIIANTYSKSLLRVAAEQMREKYSNIDYFPSYEMVMMTDRERAWRDDLRHVRDELVGQIVTHVCRAYFPGFGSSSHVDTYAAARMSLSSGRIDEAYEKLSEIAAHFREDHHFLTDFATVCMRKDRWAEAAELAKSAMEIGGESPKLLFLRARALFRAGLLSDAHSVIQRALKIDPGNVKAIVLLGKIELAIGQVAASYNQLKAVFQDKNTRAVMKNDAVATLIKLADASGDKETSRKARWMFRRLRGSGQRSASAAPQAA